MGMFDNLTQNYSFKISKIEFEVKVPISNQESRKDIFRVHREYIDFVIYSNLLEKGGIRITNLIRNRTQGSYEEVMHARALAILAYLYNTQNFPIEFFSGKGVDFAVNGIKSELKWRMLEFSNPSPTKRQPHTINSKLTNSPVYDVSRELILSLMHRLSDLTRPIRQEADLVFYECSNIIDLSMALPLDQLNRFIEPKKCRAIFYQTPFHLHGHEIFWAKDKITKSLGTPRYPNLHSFVGCHIDFDPLLWHFFSWHL